MRTEFTRICFISYERPHLITKQLDFIHSYTSMTTLLVSHQEYTTDKAARKEAKEVEQTNNSGFDCHHNSHDRSNNNIGLRRQGKLLAAFWFLLSSLSHVHTFLFYF